MLDFGRDICGDYAQATSREWLVTNGLGGYASGTISGALTRSYHGLLVAALQPPVGRSLLLTKLEEVATYDGREYALSTNRWVSGAVSPEGYRYLERWRLEGTTPVWTYALADALLEKRVFMQQGANTTYIYYTLARAMRPVTLTLYALVNHRDHHGGAPALGGELAVTPVPNGLQLTALNAHAPFYLLSDHAQATPTHDWYRDFFLAIEDYRGLNPIDHHLYAGRLTATLAPGQSLTLVASVDAKPNLNGAAALEDRRMVEAELLSRAMTPHPPLPPIPPAPSPTQGGRGAESSSPPLPAWEREPGGEGLPPPLPSKERETGGEGLPPPLPTWERGTGGEGPMTHQPHPLAEPPAWLIHLVLAADQFIVQRPLPGDADGRSVIAGYHWFGDWGRDTMIALPGLTLATGRFDIARRILRTFAHYVDQGMLPNRFPDASEEPEYNTVDATLWYFEAIRAYHAATGDDTLLAELYPVLQDIIAWHQRGTRYQIHVDPTDGLLYSGEPGVQLTWMDARVGDWVVTPRTGKAVEINALWYNALRCMAAFARRTTEVVTVENLPPSPLPTREGASASPPLVGEGPGERSFSGDDAAYYDTLADHVKQGFARFWNEERGYLYDVIDTPTCDDGSLRPNQLFAVALPYSPVDDRQAASIVDRCGRALLTSHGLRSLAPDDLAYLGHYGGDARSRDGAYHQGTVWAWLIGAFVSAHLRVHRDPGLARSFLTPLGHHLAGHCVGSLSEIFDGDPPHTPRGAMAQAWSVAEVLRVWREIEQEEGKQEDR